MRTFLAILFLFSLFPLNALAHPGRTDSDGGHTCRTNCEDWGLESGEYHDHGGYAEDSSSSGSSGSSYSSTPSCMPNSTYKSGACYCNTGYAPSLDKRTCVKIPQNAHYVGSKTDVWVCNVGYKEANNTCVKEIIPTPTPTPISTPTPSPSLTPTPTATPTPLPSQTPISTPIPSPKEALQSPQNEGESEEFSLWYMLIPLLLGGGIWKFWKK